MLQKLFNNSLGITSEKAIVDDDSSIRKVIYDERGGSNGRLETYARPEDAYQNVDIVGRAVDINCRRCIRCSI